MKNIISNSLTGFIFVLVFVMGLIYIDRLAVRNDLNLYEYAIRKATTDATYVIQNDDYQVAKNMQLDGRQIDEKERFIDREVALNQFIKTLYMNVTDRQISRGHIPVKGVVSNDGIELYTDRDGWLFKKYFFYDYGGMRYMFTLGETIKIRNLVTMNLSEDKLNNVAQIHPSMTNEQLRNHIVMKTIIDEMNAVLLSDYNLQTGNSGYGLKIQALSADKIAFALETYYNYRNNIIEGPCFVAVIDQVGLGFSGRHQYRKIEIGGAELRLSN